MAEQPAQLADVRRQIAAVATELFCRPVLIEERAYQALEVVTRHGKPPVASTIWTRLVETLPALDLVFGSRGICLHDYEDAPRPWPKQSRSLYEHHRSQIPEQFDWGRSLKKALFVEDRRHGSHLDAGPRLIQTPTSSRVAESGLVTARDLVSGVLESGVVTRLGKHRSNPVVGWLAREAGVQDPFSQSPELREFTRETIDALDRLQRVDRSLGDQQFVLFHDGARIRVAPFGSYGSYQLQERPLPDGSLWVARGNVIQPPTRFSGEAMGELEELINKDAREAEFQRFFERRPEFLLALGSYVRLHPQVVLTEEDGQRLIPDFFLEKMNSDFCDICDLKRPTVDLVRHQRNRHRFRDAVMEAAAQLTAYRDWFDEREHRDAFERRYGLKAFRPRVVIIVGRRESFYDEIERIKLESNLPSWVTLRTYDDVVDGARRWRSLVTGG